MSAEAASEMSVSRGDVRRTGAVFSNLRAAKFFSAELEKYEQEYGRVGFGPHSDIASFYFFAVLTASVATLETTYNTLIEDLNLQDREATVKKKPLLTRYAWLLRSTNQTQLDMGGPPAQRVKNLLDLRNASLHYRPRWDTNATESKKLENRFRSFSVSTSPLYAPDMPFFPYRCCSHAYAEWAIETVEQFLCDFAAQLKIEIKWLASMNT